jgi:hypothetical protein
MNLHMHTRPGILLLMDSQVAASRTHNSHTHNKHTQQQAGCQLLTTHPRCTLSSHLSKSRNEVAWVVDWELDWWVVL